MEQKLFTYDIAIYGLVYIPQFYEAQIFDITVITNYTSSHERNHE